MPVPRNAASNLWLSRVVGLGIALLGMLAVATWFADTSACWLLWVLVGVAAGLVVGSLRDIWLVGAAGIAFYPIAALVGLPSTDVVLLHWVVLTLLGMVLVASGYVIGSVARRPSRGRAPLLVGAVVLALVGIGGWAAYSGAVASEEFVHPTGKSAVCDTPASRFGWAYEAINYDQADDARLLAANPDPEKRCTDQGSRAGPGIVASDGVPVAGWYIPAANGAGPQGPTLVIAPGWKSNKSEILKYAPPFHERFNLVLVDLRNGGRSGGDMTTWGVRERLDVRAMVDWLASTKGPTWIGSVGNSMGAASVLAEAVDDPRIQALILDSMHGSLATTMGDGIEYERHLPGNPSSWAGVAMASLRVGADLTSVDPVRTIAQLGDRPVLLIHGTADHLDRPEHSAALVLAAAQAAGVPVTLQTCEGGEHGQLIDHCPGPWAGWADAFLTPLVEPASSDTGATVEVSSRQPSSGGAGAR